MRKFFESFSWAFLTVFSVPVFLIMFSWESLPGELLYPLKITLENTVALLAPTYAAKSGLYMKLTERRYVEASRLLTEQESPAGLPYISTQITEATESILKSPDTNSRRRLAFAYINTLTTINIELEAKKLAYAQIQTSRTQPAVYPPAEVQNSPGNDLPVSTPMSGPQDPEATGTVNITPTANTQLNTQVETAHEPIADQIGETQENVNEAIHDLKSVIDEVPEEKVEAGGESGAYAESEATDTDSSNKDSPEHGNSNKKNKTDDEAAD